MSYHLRPDLEPLQRNFGPASCRTAVPNHDTSHDDDLLNSREIRRMFGGVCEMTIWRWTHSEQIGFPKPVQIGRRNYWRRGDIRRWREERLGAA